MNVQRPPQLLHLQLSVRSVLVGLFGMSFKAKPIRVVQGYEKFHDDACRWFTRTVEERDTTNSRIVVIARNLAFSLGTSREHIRVDALTLSEYSALLAGPAATRKQFRAGREHA